METQNTNLDLAVLREFMVLTGFGDSPTVTVGLKRKLMLTLRFRGRVSEMYSVGELSLQDLHDICMKLGL